jgi:hypothetical protein
MLGSKFITSSVLFANSLFAFKPINKYGKAECEDKAAEKSANDLDAIFASQEGGMPPDPEEIQEMMMRA